MILSASRRTDIPCYYGEWFLNRIKAGAVVTRNPMNPSQTRRIELSPENVDCIVFWTKDAYNFLDKLDELEYMGYKSYFQFTLTPYGRDIEKNLRDKADIEDTLRALGKKLGHERVRWRYDPVILNGNMDIARHAARFGQMCERLCGYVDGVTISFIDNYAKLKTRFPDISAEEMSQIGEAFGQSAERCGMSIYTCCEKADLSKFGIRKGSCIDKSSLEKVCGHPLPALRQDKNQRPGCGCFQSVDIGAYNTCSNGCVYCYANHSRESVIKNTQRHDPLGEELVCR